MSDTENDKKIDNQHDNSQVDSKQFIKIGAYLQSIRIKKNLTEEDIYKNLKIKARIIKAIENENYANLPDTVTVTALVRQYARFLGLDSIEISNAYKNEMSGTDQKIEVTFPDKLPSSFKPFKKSIFVTGIILGIYSIWHFLNNTSNLLPQVTSIPDIVTPDSVESEAVKNVSQSDTDIATLEIIPAIDFEIVRTLEVLLQAKGGDSWIEIRDIHKKRIIYSAILKDGDSYKVPSDLTGLRLKAGNSQPLLIMINDTVVDILPKSSRVLRDFNIDTSHVLEAYQKQKIQEQE